MTVHFFLFCRKQKYCVGLKKYCKVSTNQLPDDSKTHAASSARAVTLGNRAETMGRGRRGTSGELGWSNI